MTEAKSFAASQVFPCPDQDFVVEQIEAALAYVADTRLDPDPAKHRRLLAETLARHVLANWATRYLLTTQARLLQSARHVHDPDRRAEGALGLLTCPESLLGPATGTSPTAAEQATLDV